MSPDREQTRRRSYKIVVVGVVVVVVVVVVVLVGIKSIWYPPLALDVVMKDTVLTEIFHSRISHASADEITKTMTHVLPLENEQKTWRT